MTVTLKILACNLALLSFDLNNQVEQYSSVIRKYVNDVSSSSKTYVRTGVDATRLIFVTWPTYLPISGVVGVAKRAKIRGCKIGNRSDAC